MSATASVTIFAKNPDGTPFNGDVFVFVAVPRASQEEELRLDASGFSVPVPLFKQAKNCGEGVYKATLLKNHFLAPRGTRYTVFASNNGKEPVICRHFVADSDEVSVEVEVRA